MMMPGVALTTTAHQVTVIMETNRNVRCSLLQASEAMLAVNALLGQIHSHLDVLCPPMACLPEDACQQIQPAAAKTMASIAAVHRIHQQSISQQERSVCRRQHSDGHSHALETARTAAPRAAIKEQQGNRSANLNSTHDHSNTTTSKPSTNPRHAQQKADSSATTLSSADDNLVPDIFQQLSISIHELTKSVAAIAGAADCPASPMQSNCSSILGLQPATHSLSTAADCRVCSDSINGSQCHEQQAELMQPAPTALLDSSGTSNASCAAAAAEQLVPVTAGAGDSPATSSCSSAVPAPIGNPTKSSSQKAENGSPLYQNGGSMAAAAGAFGNGQHSAAAHTAAAADDVIPHKAGATGADAADDAAVAVQEPAAPMVVEKAAACPQETTDAALEGPDVLYVSGSSSSSSAVPSVLEPAAPLAAEPAAASADKAAGTAVAAAGLLGQVSGNPSSSSAGPPSSVVSQTPTKQSIAEKLNTYRRCKDADDGATDTAAEFSNSRAAAEESAKPELQTSAGLPQPSVPDAGSNTAANPAGNSSSRSLQGNVAGSPQPSRMAIAARSLLKRRQVRAGASWQESGVAPAVVTAAGGDLHSVVAVQHAVGRSDSFDGGDITAAGLWAADTSASNRPCSYKLTMARDSTLADPTLCSTKAADQRVGSKGGAQPMQTQTADRPRSRSRGRGSLIEAAAALVLAGSPVKEVAAAAAAAARHSEAPILVLRTPGCTSGCGSPATCSSSQQPLALAQLMSGSILATPEKGAGTQLGLQQSDFKQSKSVQQDEQQQQQQQQQQDRPSRLRHRQLKSVGTNSSGKPLPPVHFQQQQQQRCRDQQQQPLGVQQGSKDPAIGYLSAVAGNASTPNRKTSIKGKAAGSRRKDQYQQQQRQLIITAKGLPGADMASSPVVNVHVPSTSRTEDSNSCSGIGGSPCSTYCKQSPLGIAAANNSIKASWVQGRWRSSPTLLDRARKLGLAKGADGPSCGGASVCRKLELGHAAEAVVHVLDSSSEEDV